MSIFGLPANPSNFWSGNVIHCRHACHCSCHISGAKHTMACCTICVICRGFVSVSDIESHLEQCHPDRDKEYVPGL